jgi:hypothetical protein
MQPPSGFAHRVTLVVRANSLQKGMSDYLVKQIQVAPNIDLRLGAEVIGGEGAERLERVTIRDNVRNFVDTIPTTAHPSHCRDIATEITITALDLDGLEAGCNGRGHDIGVVVRIDDTIAVVGVERTDGPTQQPHDRRPAACPNASHRAMSMPDTAVPTRPCHPISRKRRSK